MATTNKKIHWYKVRNGFQRELFQEISKSGGVAPRDVDNGPSLVVFAGPNGAGKSKYVSYFFRNDINWDEDLIFTDLEDRLKCSGFDYSERDVNEIIDDLRRQVLKKVIEFGLTMVFHTNFSSLFLNKNSFQEFFGKEVLEVSMSLFFIDTLFLHRSIARVKERVSRGGHEVELEEIRENFEISVKNIPRHLTLFDSIRIHTNAIDLQDIEVMINENSINRELASIVLRDDPVIYICGNNSIIRKDAFRSEPIYTRYENLIRFLIQKGIAISIV